jgi:hypothetical protein
MVTGRASTFGGGIRTKPGLVNITDPLGAQIEFLASENYTVKRSGATLLATGIAADVNGNKIVKAGTVLGKKTSGPNVGMYVPYADDATEGADTAVGFLFAGDMNVRDGDWFAIGVMITGSVIAARCTGLTTAARADLAAHFTFQ